MGPIAIAYSYGNLGLETCQELGRSLDRAAMNLELVRNRSEKVRGRVHFTVIMISAQDRKRAEMVQSVMDRLRVLETDLSRLVQEGGVGVGADGEDGSSNFQF